tara:strand:- start:312 stop:719 length:408 start_codon:yes stop_codon:yes gene_type:complete
MKGENETELPKQVPILKRLESLMVEHDIQPEELINLLRPEKIPISRRNALRGGLAIAGIAALSGSAQGSGDVSSGQIASQITQTASLRGTDDSEIADLSGNYLDLSPKGFFVLPVTSGSSPAGVQPYSLWFDSSV